MKTKFNSLLQLTTYFSSKQRCVDHLAQLRWPEGKPVCVHCGSVKCYVCKGYGKYKCGDCKSRFSITTGTFFENTKLPLNKWFIAMYLCLSRKKGTSSHQLARDLGISQKSSWFVLHRIRELVTEKAPGMLFNEGIVEVDECYIGGKDVNRHGHKKVRKQNVNDVIEKPSPIIDKHMVVGIIQRGGKVYTEHVHRANLETLKPLIIQRVDPNVRVITDEHYAYSTLKWTYLHDQVNHSAKVWTIADAHTNTIENYWSVVKRCVYGTYHQLSGKHLQSYLSEFTFRYDTRTQSEEQRFLSALKRCNGRLKWDQLVSRPTPKSKNWHSEK
ncbi:MAG TPA: IS1595 family transposase [Bacteroidia bacterium]|nr:IS1595 family transposase [Bacteroidia bacterium]